MPHTWAETQRRRLAHLRGVVNPVTLAIIARWIEAQTITQTTAGDK